MIPFTFTATRWCSCLVNVCTLVSMTAIISEKSVQSLPAVVSFNLNLSVEKTYLAYN